MLSILDKIINETEINFKFVDLGGGMGISYSNKEKKLNLKRYSQLVEKFMKNKNAKIIFEPGRVIVGNAGLLISKILILKKVLTKNLLF